MLVRRPLEAWIIFFFACTKKATSAEGLSGECSAAGKDAFNGRRAMVNGWLGDLPSELLLQAMVRTSRRRQCRHLLGMIPGSVGLGRLRSKWVPIKLVGQPHRRTARMALRDHKTVQRRSQRLCARSVQHGTRIHARYLPPRRSHTAQVGHLRG